MRRELTHRELVELHMESFEQLRKKYPVDDVSFFLGCKMENRRAHQENTERSEALKPLRERFKTTEEAKRDGAPF